MAAEEKAVFAGGCFWCMESPFDALKDKGVISTTVGYSGGGKVNPTYKEVSHGGTGHREVIEVVFDPSKITYRELLNIFWKNVDPVDSRGQFCDHGEQYTSAIFTYSDEQKKVAEDSRNEIEKKLKERGVIKNGMKLETKILPGKEFYAAEDYHQDYYLKNPLRYKFYRFNCGRDKRLKEVWGESAH